MIRLIEVFVWHSGPRPSTSHKLWFVVPGLRIRRQRPLNLAPNFLFSDSPRLLPSPPLEIRHNVEVLVAAEDRQSVLQRKGRDPGIVSRDRTTGMLENRT